MSPVVLVTHLMYILKMYPKWLLVGDYLCLLCTSDLREVSCHNIHHMIQIFRTKYLEWSILLGLCLKNIKTINLLMFKVSINKAPRKSFWTLMSLIY